MLEVRLSRPHAGLRACSLGDAPAERLLCATNMLDLYLPMFVMFGVALVICGVAGLMWCGIMMTIGRRSRSAMAADGASGIPWVLGGLTCGLVAAAVVAMMLGL